MLQQSGKNRMSACACTHAHTRTHMHTHTHAQTHAHTHAHTRAHARAHARRRRHRHGNRNAYCDFTHTAISESARERHTHSHTHTHNCWDVQSIRFFFLLRRMSRVNIVWGHVCIHKHCNMHCKTLKHTATHCNARDLLEFKRIHLFPLRLARGSPRLAPFLIGDSSSHSSENMRVCVCVCVCVYVCVC